MECATALKDHDDAKIQGWKEEIDTHLVFAGLFSAILTAFNIEAYKLLGGNNPSSNSSADTTNQLLALLVQQTATTNNLGNVLNTNATAFASKVFISAQQDASSNPTKPAASAIAINALWFSSLICSLAAASISILVKQWLNEYKSGMASVSLEVARIRQFRNDGLKKWRVQEIMMLLPILLQGALVLFLIGLILFLTPLDNKGAVTKAAIVLISSLLFFLGLTTLLPTFAQDCAYRSPQAWGVFVVIQSIKKPIRNVARRLYSLTTRMADRHADGTFSRLRVRMAKSFVRMFQRFANKPNTYSWKARERVLVEGQGRGLDQHLLVGADATFLDDTFLRNVIQPCLNDMEPLEAVNCYFRLMSHRAHRVEDGVQYFENKATESKAESLAILAEITLETIRKSREEPIPIEHPIQVLRTMEPLLVRTLPLVYPRFCEVMFGLLGDQETTVRRMGFSILYQQLSRNLDLAEQYAAAGCHHDLGALVAFVDGARRAGDVKDFLDGCDLVICLATLDALPSPDTAVRTHLRDTLVHLQAFLESPLWKNVQPRMLLYPISRITPHLVALERRYLGVLEDKLVEVLEQVVHHAKALNHDGNWEDKIIILETTLHDLRSVRLGGSSAGSVSTLNEDRAGHGRRPSFMRNALTPTLGG
ncbi:hypothetical protein GSI_05220 [Ganoderma sinense ZZ0214-1]|uniref:DUF6535 domain-containing protein n=1 Tax=Ganoderma sinense ZZ0214-1 TaxID=1077348 RepID=A0A2G8SFP5_9APHY|nr:hypothetical protein GSI_05220 [Ganoderma sinense ZZ0214-1]